MILLYISVSFMLKMMFVYIKCILYTSCKRVQIKGMFVMSIYVVELVVKSQRSYCCMFL